MLSKEELFEIKAQGFSDSQLAVIFNITENEIRKIRYEKDIRPVYKMIDTCAGEIESKTPYTFLEVC